MERSSPSPKNSMPHPSESHYSHDHTHHDSTGDESHTEHHPVDASNPETRSEDEEPNLLHPISGRSSDLHPGHHQSHHHKESVEFTLEEGARRFRVFLGDDVTLRAAFPDGKDSCFPIFSDSLLFL